jgi:hypothetical protein
MGVGGVLKCNGFCGLAVREACDFELPGRHFSKVGRAGVDFCKRGDVGFNRCGDCCDASRKAQGADDGGLCGCVRDCKFKPVACSVDFLAFEREASTGS